MSNFVQERSMVGLVVLALALLSTSASAHEKVTDLKSRSAPAGQENAQRLTPGPRYLRDNPQRMFRRLDTDNNEVITLDEMLTSSLDRADVMFSSIDSDGLISQEEFLAIAGERRSPEVTAGCVADHLDRDLPVRPDPETKFNSSDQNTDGYIDSDEFLLAMEETATNRFSDIDSDGDAGITRREFYRAQLLRRETRRALRLCAKDNEEVLS